jgi:hypothetical protein
MNHLIRLVLLWQAAVPAPFWETKEPAKWTDTEIETLMSQSPWGSSTSLGGAIAFVASAKPLRDAEQEIWKRRELRGEVKADEEDYHTYITQNPGKHIVLAVRMPLTLALSNAKEMKTMEKECFVRVGKQKVRAIGHFPPTPSDPYLRLLFPRVPIADMKMLSFGLYLPGVHKPFQDVDLPVKELVYRGQPEY